MKVSEEVAAIKAEVAALRRLLGIQSTDPQSPTAPSSTTIITATSQWWWATFDFGTAAPATTESKPHPVLRTATLAEIIVVCATAGTTATTLVAKRDGTTIETVTLAASQRYTALTPATEWIFTKGTVSQVHPTMQITSAGTGVLGVAAVMVFR